MKECESFIKIKREERHQKTLKRQLSKFERLCHRNAGGRSNNQDGMIHVWTNNMNERGPNFTIVPKEPPVIEYVAAIEKACQQLKQGEAEELQGEIKSIIKKIHPQT